MVGVSYEWDVLGGPYNARANPCTGDTWGTASSTFAVTESLLARGEAQLLCVRTTDEDNRALSFAWAVTTPEEPDTGAISPAGGSSMATTSWAGPGST